MSALGNLELGLVPRIVVPLSDLELDAHGRRARDLADAIELRIDRFERHDADYVRGVCKRARELGLPLLATVRAVEEGGATRLDDDRRASIFDAVTPLVDGLDIELHATIREPVVHLGHRHRKLIIVSRHDFLGTPEDREMVGWIERAAQAGADITKLATTTTTRADLERLAALLLEQRGKSLIVIAMGEIGAASRVFFPLLGSLLTYGFVDRAGAPGQLSADTLVEELRRYAPDFALERDRRASR